MIREENKVRTLTFVHKLMGKGRDRKRVWSAEERIHKHYFIYVPHEKELIKFNRLTGRQICEFSVIRAAGRNTVKMIVRIHKILPQKKEK